MKAYKLKSGHWRAQANYTIDGKRFRKSFTASTKRKAEMLAIMFLDERREAPEKITLETAARHYIEGRQNVLSPTTLAEYRHIVSRYPDLFGRMVSEIDQRTVQIFVSRISSDHSPKYVRNVHGFVASVLKTCRPDLVLHTAMPQNIRTDLYTPTKEDMKRLLAAVKGTDMEVPVLLASMGSLRRSEVCALDREDIRPTGAVRVSKALVRDQGGGFKVKTTKTTAGDRTTWIPPKVAKRILEITKPGPVTDLKPDMLTRKLPKILDSLGLPRFRFHALRSYYATTMHAAGIPDKFIQQFGGWSDVQTLQRHYEKAAKDIVPEMARKGMDAFGELL